MTNAVTPNVATTAEAASRIIPRAEYRVFGQNIIEPLKARLWNGRTVLNQARKMPAETYFLSRRTNDVNVKVRDGLLDIKVKTGQTPEGFEIFQPRGKFQFPVKREDLTTILAHLQADVAVERDTCTFDEFLAMARRHPLLVPVNVEKMRFGFTIDGVICEYAQVWFNGALVESACAESENYEAMRGVVELLGLTALPNTNYLKAAKSVVGIE